MIAKLEEVLHASGTLSRRLAINSAIKREMESANNHLDKKIRLDTKPTFKKLGHDKQHQFNEQVQDKINTAAATLEQTPPAVEKGTLASRKVRN